MNSRYLAEKLAAEDLMIELGKEVERLRSESGPALPTTTPETIRLEELHQELEELRQAKKSLIEQNEELQAMVLTRGVEEGRNLLNGTSNSLAQELDELNDRQVNIMHFIVITIDSSERFAPSYTKEEEKKNAQRKITSIPSSFDLYFNCFTASNSKSKWKIGRNHMYNAFQFICVCLSYRILLIRQH